MVQSLGVSHLCIMALKGQCNTKPLVHSFSSPVVLLIHLWAAEIWRHQWLRCLLSLWNYETGCQMVLVVLKALKECILKSSTAMSLFQKHVPVLFSPNPSARINVHQVCVCWTTDQSELSCNFTFLHNTGLQLCLGSGTKTTGLGLGEPHGLDLSSGLV